MNENLTRDELQIVKLALNAEVARAYDAATAYNPNYVSPCARVSGHISEIMDSMIEAELYAKDIVGTVEGADNEVPYVLNSFSLICDGAKATFLRLGYSDEVAHGAVALALRGCAEIWNETL